MRMARLGEGAAVLDLPFLDAGAEPVGALAARWRREPLLIHGSWVDPGDLDLSLDGVGELLKALPPGRVAVREVGDAPGAPHRETAFTQAPLSAQLAERRLHITALDLADVSAPFARMLDRFVAHVRPAFAHTDGARLEANIGVFIGSGASVVPFHVDFEHNFLIHVVGEKVLTIYPRLDPEIMTEPVLENLARDMGPSRFLTYAADYDARARAMRLSPGTATYQPPLAPHWVRSAEGPTMSIAIGLFTSDELGERMAYLANHSLRRLGVRPSPVGRRPWLDGMKVGVMGAMRDTMRALRPVRQVRGRSVDLRRGGAG